MRGIVFGDSALWVAVARPFPTPENALCGARLRGLLLHTLRGLPERERSAVSLRFGLDDEPMSYRSVGKRLGVGGGRAQQIEARALNRLRARMVDALLTTHEKALPHDERMRAAWVSARG